VVQVTVGGRLVTGLTAHPVFALQVTLPLVTPSGPAFLLLPVLAIPYSPSIVAVNVTDDPYPEGFVPPVSETEVLEVALVMLKLSFCGLPDPP
jgi:hypothetical protein